jgi:hypothetical protein
MLWFVGVGVRERKEFVSDQFSILLNCVGNIQVIRHCHEAYIHYM